MKTKFDMSNLSRSLNKVGLLAKKHSPAILMGVGAVGVVASTVMACKATLKVNEVLEETKDTVEKIHECKETMPEKYSEQDAKKDLITTYTHTGVKLAKLYGPAVIVGVASLGCMLTSHRILTKRNVALAAAYTAVDKSFKQYRSRVVERFGEQLDKELKYNIKAKEIEETATDENGNEQTVKSTKFVINPSDISEYARFFEEYTKDEKGNVVKNTYWNESPEDNLIFLKQVERFCNQKLRIKGVLFLNDVYEALGLPISKAGQVVGWVYNEKEPVGDNYVDFGLYKDNLSYSDFVNGYDNAILLDFNVDGNVWELM